MATRSVKDRALSILFNYRKTPTVLNDSYTNEIDNLVFRYEKPSYLYLWRSIWPFFLPIFLTTLTFTQSTDSLSLAFLIVFLLVLWFGAVKVSAVNILHFLNPGPEWIIDKNGVTFKSDIYKWNEIKSTYFIRMINGAEALKIKTNRKELELSISGISLSQEELAHYIEVFKRDYCPS
ncbi:hypothetical protein [Fulvivirga lutimaris]|uniref:hypothetical protein n=1 Tax=Fulvivirga lutimaris TaxID=1819566 RepID=UPI0012BD523B|nr:hypothetical protein [Fulvivirga lutimaris]MTI40279.1 hypothetical protein [Fulvivirga lutimaris]